MCDEAAANARSRPRRDHGGGTAARRSGSETGRGALDAAGVTGSAGVHKQA